MNKPNDFLAASLNAPQDFTLTDYYTHGLTPDNTELKDRDYYKDIPQVQKTFTKNDGTFDDVKFNAYYDSVKRTYNDWAETDFVRNLLNNIPRAKEDISDLGNLNVRNTDVRLFELNDPWRHQRGMGNVYTTGKESFDIREVAQANKVHDANGNELDYTPNDKGLIKGLFSKPLVLAEDENGEPLLNKNGDPYYRELKDGESIYGKQLLHWSDTFTPDDSWLNKFDFFDNDGLDKSVMGTIMNTVFRIGPYFIPYVGPVLGAIDAARGLAEAVPALAKAVNGIITNDSDNTDFGKTMNTIEAYAQRYGQSKSRYSQEHNWSFENIGDMISTSAAQLYQQRTFQYIPALLKMQDAEKATKLGQALSLGFMAATSAQDSLETFKNAGLSDRAAGVAMLGYTSALYWMMNQDYFKDQLFSNTWLNSDPEMRNILRQNNEEAARIALNSIQNAAKPNAVRITTQESLKHESASMFKKVWNATVSAWKTKSWSPFKGMNLVAPGSAFFTESNIYMNRALNEGVEEVMEEAVLDIIKATNLGLEALGFNIKDETKERINFGLSVDDILQRYSTAFVGGAIGGAVFQGLDNYNRNILNKDVSDYAGRGLNGQLIRAIRNNGVDKVLASLESLRRKGKLGNKNLGSRGQYVVDPENKDSQRFVFNAGTDTDNQNEMMYNIMATRIKALDSAMRYLGLSQDDNTILQSIKDDIEKTAKEAGMDVEEYKRKYKRDLFSEFVEKTGFADIILNDVGNLEIDALEYDAKIEEQKSKIKAKYTDTQHTQAEEEIKNDKFIKEWTKKRDEAIKLRDDIVSGKATGQYVRYASFVSHDNLVSKFLGKRDNDTKLDVQAYTWAKYKITYDSLSEDDKKKMDDEYVEYQKLNGIDALYQANSLFQSVSNILKPYINKNNIDYSEWHLAKDISEDVLGSILDLNASNLDNIAPGEVLNRTFTNSDKHLLVDSVLNVPNSKSVQALLNSIQGYYKSLNENKIIAEYGDDFAEYALNRLEKILPASVNDKELLKDITKALESEKYIKDQEIVAKWDNGDSSISQEDYENAFNDSTNYDSLEELHGQEVEQQRIINQLKAILPNVTSDPDTALRQFEDLKSYIESKVSQKELVEPLIKVVIGPYEDFAKTVKEIQKEKSKNQHSPIVELMQAISYQLNGTEIPILDTIADEKASLISKNRTSEYILTSDLARKQLEAAKNLQPMVEAALFAAASGINTEANNFLDESEKLPEIDLNLYMFYASDFKFISNKIDFLLKLHDLNKNAKVREHILVRKNFYKNVAGRLFKSMQNDEVNPFIDKLQKSLGGIDLSVFWSEVGGNALNLLSDDEEDQVKVMTAFTNFEHKVYEWTKTHVSDITTLGKDIATCFDDAYKMKNGILSSNSDDDIDNFDLLTYLLMITGTDSYEFDPKIKKYFEGDDKFPFFGQELAIRFAYLAINNIDIINGALSGIEESTEEAIANHVIKDVENGVPKDEITEKSKKYLEDKSKLWNTIVIDGFAGVGKSTVISKIAFEISDNVEVIAVSTHADRAKALGSQFSADDDHIKVVDGLLTEMLGKTYVDSEWIATFRGHDAKLKNKKDLTKDEQKTAQYDPIVTNATFKNLFKDANKKHIVAIDECTQLSEGKWQIICDAAQKEGVIIIGLGNTMQTGAVSIQGNSVNSVNLDDCVYLSTSKLTVSMRTANAGKNENNIKLGTLAKIASDLQKDHPTYELPYLSKDPSLDQETSLIYNDENGRVSGDMIVSSINDTTIDSAVSALNEDETLVVITNGDNDFAASREKYGTLKTSEGKPKVVFSKEFTVGGEEYDFAIINVDFSENPDNKITEIKRLYTLATRSRKGSIIKQSNGLSNVLKVSSVPSPNASSETTFDKDSEIVKQYKATRLSALNNIPEQSAPVTVVTPDNSENGGGDGFPAPEVDFTRNPDGSEKVTEEEILESVDEDTQDPNNIADQGEATDDYWITSGAVRGYKAKQYAKRKSMLANRDSNLIDGDIFADWLMDKDNALENAYSGLNTDNPVIVQEFKEKVVKPLSSIFLTEKELDRRSKAFQDRISSWLNQNKDKFKSDFVNSLEDAVINGNGVFFTKRIENSEKQMMVYYCFGNKYAIPITIINIARDTDDNEHFYKDLIFTQQTGIIPISSNGRKRSKVSDTIGNFVNLVSVEGTPITAVFTPNQEVQATVNENKRNKYFLNNKGKAFIGFTSAAGLTPDESRAQFDVQRDENGNIEYFVQDSEGSFAIAGVQEDIDVDKFFSILEDVGRLMSTNVDSQGNDLIVQRIADFFGLSEEEVKTDFATMLSDNPNESSKENARKFGKVRSKYNILYQREIELLTTALLQYCVDHDSQALEYLTENMYIMLSDSYTRATNANVNRTQGLRITAYNKKHQARTFEIIPQDAGLSKFNIYRSELGGVRIKNQGFVAEIDGSNFLDGEGINKRINHRKFIQSVWSRIVDETISADTTIDPRLAKQNLTDDDVDALIKTGSLSLSLTTESQDNEEGTVVKYFSPFESKLLTLSSYPRSTGKTGRFIDDKKMSEVMKTSSIFTYGIYRQIIARDEIVANNPIWKTGKVTFDHLTWDITKVLAPVYSAEFIKITPDNDPKSDVEYKKLYSQLTTKQLGDNSNNRVTVSGTNITLDYAINVDDNEKWDKAFGKQVADEMRSANWRLHGFIVSQNNEDIVLTAIFENQNGGQKVYNVDQNQMEILLSDIPHEKIDLLSLLNHKVIASIDGKDFVGTSNIPKIVIDGKPETIKFSAISIDKEGTYTLFIKSASGLTKLNLSGDYSGIEDFIGECIKKHNVYGNYIGSPEEDIDYYYNGGLYLTRKSSDATDRVWLKEVDNSGVSIMDNFGIVTTIPFTSLENGNDLASAFDKPLLKIDSGQPKLLKKDNVISVIGGKFLISTNLIAPIVPNIDLSSDYIEFNSINIDEVNGTVITLNNIPYRLDTIITAKFIDNWFGDYYAKVNPKLSKKVSQSLKTISGSLIDFDEFVASLDENSYIEQINDYLKQHILALNGIYSIEITNNGNISLSKDNSANAAIKLEILKTFSNVDLSSIPDNIIDSKNILNYQDFSVTLSNGSEISGSVERIGNEWKVKFTTNLDSTIESLETKLNELEENGEIITTDVDYFRYRLDKIKSKSTTTVASFTIYGIQLARRAKANPDSAEAKFLRDLNRYNEKCDII